MKEITFDRFIRTALWVVLFVALGLLVRSLSSVLMPFFIAWILAYMMYPMVCFFQYRLHLPGRAVSIIVTMAVVLAVTVGLLVLTVPPTIAEIMKLKDVAVDYFSQITADRQLGEMLRQYSDHYLSDNRWMTLIQNNNLVSGVREASSQLLRLIASTIELATGLFSVFVTLLYFFFILLDYESLSGGWIRLVPRRNRKIVSNIVRDLKTGMSAYFRGQAIVAFCVGILFSIGFLIIDFPMAIGLGMFIGLLNLVPYLQLLGFIPTIILSLIKSAQGDGSFWGIFLAACAVFVIVQTIQDLLLTPRIMGKAMGLHPAIIFLSLSVWGSLLGFIGLVIALPLTTILISYYRQILDHYDKSQGVRGE